MKARLIKFGEIEGEGERYTHDVVIDGGTGLTSESLKDLSLPASS
jgi:hypothetical protein